MKRSLEPPPLSTLALLIDLCQERLEGQGQELSPLRRGPILALRRQGWERRGRQAAEMFERVRHSARLYLPR
ncbi:MAG TPA: hypothetical protein VNO81_04360 [Candidatus Nitrosotenuis sp.]|jgi:hypothetical protein|nr:hypothetical protein [Candidatus Nitrosotenuis sp.]